MFFDKFSISKDCFDPKKSFNQIKDAENSFLAIDGVEFGRGNKIPLWLFGSRYKHELLNNLFFHPYTKIEFVERDMMVLRKTARDELNAQRLDTLAWTVITVWECELGKNTDAAIARIEADLRAAKEKYDKWTAIRRYAKKAQEEE